MRYRLSMKRKTFGEIPLKCMKFFLLFICFADCCSALVYGSLCSLEFYNPRGNDDDDIILSVCVCEDLSIMLCMRARRETRSDLT